MLALWVPVLKEITEADMLTGWSTCSAIAAFVALSEAEAVDV